MRTRCSLGLGLPALLAVAVPGSAQQYIDNNLPTTFYLHRGSSYQTGCWGDCACPLNAAEPMHGSFVLHLVSVGNATDFYRIDQIDWRIPTFASQPFNRVIIGSGPFSAGQAPFASHQFASLDLIISPATPLWTGEVQFSGGGTRTVDPPIMDISIANTDVGCPGIRMRLLASWYKSDWNASGQVSTQDLFDFLDDYFLNRADYTGTGATSVQDLFDFLGDFFAGI